MSNLSRKDWESNGIIGLEINYKNLPCNYYANSIFYYLIYRTALCSQSFLKELSQELGTGVSAVPIFDDKRFSHVEYVLKVKEPVEIHVILHDRGPDILILAAELATGLEGSTVISDLICQTFNQLCKTIQKQLLINLSIGKPSKLPEEEKPPHIEIAIRIPNSDFKEYFDPEQGFPSQLLEIILQRLRELCEGR